MEKIKIELEKEQLSAILQMVKSVNIPAHASKQVAEILDILEKPLEVNAPKQGEGALDGS